MPATVLTIGNFDGVHLGHAALIARARQLAPHPHGRVIALTFDPHPATILAPARAPTPLLPFSRREALLREAGADEVVKLTPTPDFLAMPPQLFIERLRAAYAPTAFVEGPDFHFGAKRAGTIEVLQELGRAMGFWVEIVPPVEVGLVDGMLVTASSTLARALIATGRVADAARILGRPYELRGTVVQGDRRGRTVGFPTANLKLDADWTDVGLPQDGVYAGVGVLPDGSRHPAMVNLGTRPTVNGREHRIEPHLIMEGSSDTRHATGEDKKPWSPLPGLPEYGWPLTLELHRWIRDQVKFPSFEALVGQLHRDRETTLTTSF